MKLTYSVGAFSLAMCLSLGVAVRARAFDDPEKMCQKQAASAMNVSRSDIEIRRGDNLNDGSGNYIVNWEARLHGGAHQRGYCQVDPRQRRIVRFESNEFGGGSDRYTSPDDLGRICRAEAARRLGLDFRDITTADIRNDDDGNFLIKWFTQARGNSGGACEVDRRGNLVSFKQDGAMEDGRPGFNPAGGYPRVKLDTAGDGTFDGGRFRNIRLQSVYLDTRERPTLILRGVHEFRIEFYGEVEGYDSANHFVLRLRIKGSDHGDVQGLANLHLNLERNEIDGLDFQGTMDGTELNSNFRERR